MKKWKFVSVMTGVPPVESDTFDGAFRAMYAYVKNLLATKQATYQVLETAIWIVPPTGVAIYFYDARDMACETGLMDILKAEDASAVTA